MGRMAGVSDALNDDLPSDEDHRLSAQLTRLDSVLEHVPLAIALFDEELRLLRANQRYRDLTGTDIVGALGRSVYDAFPNALADLDDVIDRVVSGARVEPTRVAFRPRIGAERMLEVVFTAVAPASAAPGNEGGLLFVGTDVTDREQLRADLARSIAQLETIFDVIPDSVRVFDVDGKIARSNAQAALEHGAAHPAALEDLWRLDRPRGLDGVSLFVHEHPTARALGGERVRGWSLAVRRGDGTQPSAVVEVNSNPLRDESGKIRGAVTVERDVTERTRLSRQLEEQVRRTAELYERVSTEAERLERMVEARTQELLELQEERARERRLTAVGQLAAGVMHDVNNALNPIMAAAYLLEANATNPEAVIDYAQRIAKAAETGAATAARVGRFIRQEPLQGEREELVNLSAMADEVVAMTQPLWAERSRGAPIAFDRNFQPEVTIRGISGEIREALLNLVQNALDALTGGGTLGITTHVSGATACIDVSDTGVGMTEEVRERAFDPFFTTKGRRGTGLGLSEVYGIVKRHRGQAEIESAPGAGTTVHLCFPLANPSDVPPLPEPKARKRSPRRVLVVEDNDDGRDFMKALLESDGHTVDAVTTIRDALARLGTLGSRYDVLVTDIGLPDGNGWELVESARTAYPSLRIGVVTGWEIRTAEASGADFTLRKPVAARELLSLVVAAE